MNSTIKYILTLIFTLFLVFVVQIFFFTLGKVSGDSMLPNLHDGDIVIIDKISPKLTEIKRFDIVAVKFPSQKNLFVKRVIGLPNEYLEVKQNKLYINNNLIEQHFLSENIFTDDFSTKDIINNNNGMIPNNFYLVMGDNRSNSLDGRRLGFIEKDNISIVHKINLFDLFKYLFSNSLYFIRYFV